MEPVSQLQGLALSWGLTSLGKARLAPSWGTDPAGQGPPRSILGD